MRLPDSMSPLERLLVVGYLAVVGDHVPELKVRVPHGLRPLDQLEIESALPEAILPVMAQLILTHAGAELAELAALKPLVRLPDGWGRADHPTLTTCFRSPRLSTVASAAMSALLGIGEIEVRIGAGSGGYMLLLAHPRLTDNLQREGVAIVLKDLAKAAKEMEDAAATALAPRLDEMRQAMAQLKAASPADLEQATQEAAKRVGGGA